MKIIDKMEKQIDDEVKHSIKKKSKINRLFICGSTQTDPNTKTTSKSMKKKFKSFWGKKVNGSKDETKWLLDGSTSSLIYTNSKESERETKGENKPKIKKQNKVKEEKKKEVKEKQKKSKGLLKRVGKMTLKTCRYITLGSAPGFALNPYPYNYETHSYDYYNPMSYGFQYPGSQSYSPSLFF